MRLIVFATCALAGTALAQQPPVTAPPDKVLLLGAQTREVRTHIVKLDNGARHWDFSGEGGLRIPTSEGQKTTGTRIAVPAGHYDLNVICGFLDWESHSIQFVPGIKAVSAQAGHVYQIMGSLSGNKKQCNVSLTGVN